MRDKGVFSAKGPYQRKENNVLRAWNSSGRWGSLNPGKKNRPYLEKRKDWMQRSQAANNSSWGLVGEKRVVCKRNEEKGIFSAEFSPNTNRLWGEKSPFLRTQKTDEFHRCGGTWRPELESGVTNQDAEMTLGKVLLP